MEEYKKGRLSLENNNIQAAETYFLEGASKKDPRCVYGLFVISALTGKASEIALKNLQSVFPSLLSLANSDIPDACFIVARCYETGSAVCADLHLALEYYHRAANLGNSDAMYNLGCIYMHFEGATERTLSFFKEAAKCGCKDAEMALLHHKHNENG